MSVWCPHPTRFTVRGHCAECAPELHAQFQLEMDAAKKLDNEFKATTGKGTLEDWYGFEKFIEKRGMQ